MYPPLKEWLEEGGYTVNAEVNGCDVVARKGDDVVVVEMKLSLNLDLLLQVVERQGVADSVYAAVPAPKAWDKRWRRLMRLVRRLEAGLILVHLESAVPRVEVEFHPLGCERRQKPSERRALLKEMAGRTLDLNVGGTTRMKRVTAYRERAILVAAGLERIGPCSPKALRALGTGEKTLQILSGNHYGWFERLGKGVYGLTGMGRDGLLEYGELAEALRCKLAVPGEKAAAQACACA